LRPAWLPEPRLSPPARWHESASAHRRQWRASRRHRSRLRRTFQPTLDPSFRSPRRPRLRLLTCRHDRLPAVPAENQPPRKRTRSPHDVSRRLPAPVRRAAQRLLPDRLRGRPTSPAPQRSAKSQTTVCCVSASCGTTRSAETDRLVDSRASHWALRLSGASVMT
jgi:hypothetical protein